MKFYLIAGEASGDLHGSNLIQNLKKADPEAQFRVWGGNKMEEAGAKLVKHYRDHSFMGFLPVIQNLGTIKRNFREAKEDIMNFKPDVLILIDYSGFNLRLAKMLFPADFKIFYYISPQVWAWRSGRVEKIKKYTDQLFSILPFEKTFYKEKGLEVEYVGHPLLDVIADFKKEYSESIENFRKKNSLSDLPIVGILPGSRKQEIESKLPVMLEVAEKYKDQYQFVIAGTSNIDRLFYEDLKIPEYVKLVMDQTYPILNFSVAAMVTSGTATMETAIFKVPQVVCYRADRLSYLIVKNLVGKKIKYISMVNLIMQKEVVKELIQSDLNEENLYHELDTVINDQTSRTEMLENYDQLISKLGNSGASQRAAEKIISLAKHK